MTVEKMLSLALLSKAFIPMARTVTCLLIVKLFIETDIDRESMK
jgi:hypothetical protein